MYKHYKKRLGLLIGLILIVVLTQLNQHLPTDASQLANANSFMLQTSAHTLTIDDTAKIVVNSNQTRAFNAFQFELAYNQAILLPSNITTADEIAEQLRCFFPSSSNVGITRFACVSEEEITVTAGQAIATVQFETIGLGQSNVSLTAINLLKDESPPFYAADGASSVPITVNLGTTKADLSDLDASYGLAWHTTSQTHLGEQIDSDVNGQLQTDDASDDGIDFRVHSSLSKGEVIATHIQATGDGYLAAWFDWDQNGRFDPISERGLAQPVTNGNNKLALIVPTDYEGDKLAARFRLYDQQPTTLQPIGAATDGEVEDYLWSLRDTNPITTAILNFFDNNMVLLVWLLLALILFALHYHYHSRQWTLHHGHQILSLVLVIVMFSETLLPAISPAFAAARHGIYQQADEDTPLETDDTPLPHSGRDCEGTDLNCDSTTDSQDIEIIEAHWGCAAGDNCYLVDYDFDNNQLIDIHDIYQVRQDTKTDVIAAERPVLSETTTILFVADSTDLNQGDTAIQQHLENQDYIVVIIDDDVLSTTHTLNADLIYLSDSVHSGRVNTILRDTTLPLITNESYLFDDLEMTAAADNKHGEAADHTHLTITDPTHPIAAALSGDVAVYTTTGNLHWGIPSEAAHVIATVPGQPDRATLFVYEQNTPMDHGFLAPARRVGFFFHSVTSDDILKATPASWAMFDAAVTWALALPGENLSDNTMSLMRGSGRVSIEEADITTGLITHTSTPTGANPHNGMVVAMVPDITTGLLTHWHLDETSGSQLPTTVVAIITMAASLAPVGQLMDNMMALCPLMATMTMW